ncbi:MAG: CHAT domain-containing protein [Moorea sp. SIO2B7]|nr:CHAT domain-containing protein [Moorena sp. SIO2B7]
MSVSAQSLYRINVVQGSSVNNLLDEGRRLYEAGNFQDAVFKLRQAANDFNKQEDILKEAMTLTNLSLVYQRLGDWDKAKAVIDKSLGLLENPTSNEQKLKLLAAAYDVQGQLYLAQGQIESAIESFSAAINNYQESGDELGVIQSQINKIQAFLNSGRYRLASQIIQEIESNLRQQQDSTLKAIGLRSLGNTLRLVGNIKPAQDVLKESLKLAENVSSSQDISAALLSLGNIAKGEAKKYQYQGNIKEYQDKSEKALEYYERAITEALNIPRTRIKAQLNLLSLLVDNQLLLNAKEEENKKTYPVEKFDREESTSLIFGESNIVELDLTAEDNREQDFSIDEQRAEEELSFTQQLIIDIKSQLKKLPISQISVDARINLAGSMIALMNIEKIESQKINEQNNNTESQEITESNNNSELQDIAKQNNNTQSQEITDENDNTQSQYIVKQQNKIEPQDIAEQLSIAIKNAQKIKKQSSEAYALGKLGKLYENNQQLDAALKVTKQALSLAQSINAPDIAYRLQWQLANLLKNQASEEDSISEEIRQQMLSAYKAAIKNIESLRSDQVSMNRDVQFSFRDSIEPIYRELVGLLLQSSDETQPSDKDLAEARNVIESLQQAELVNFFRENCLNLNEIEIEKIDPKAAVIYPIVLKDRLEVVVSLPNNSESENEDKKNKTTLEHQTIVAPEFEAIVSELREVIAPPSKTTSRKIEDRTRDNLDTILDIARRRGIGVTPIDGTIVIAERQKLYKNIAGQVYDWLIRPFEKQIEASEVETLVFVLDGPLLNLPMAVLYDSQNDEFLMQKYAIALTPGLQLLDSKKRVKGELNAVKAGISEAVEDFSPLPYVEKELEAIEGEAPGKLILNEKFTIDVIENAIRSVSFPIVHLATHGQFSSDPEDTFILTWDDRLNVNQLNTLLQIREEIGTDTLELLVLSACETATGDKRAALGLAGVAVRSGARSTLATLWQVDDEGTKDLMIEFYKQLRDDISKAEALRRAQMALMEKDDTYKEPYYWAPFVLVGNWL